MSTPLVRIEATTLSPVARTCRDVINSAAAVTRMLLGNPDPDQPDYTSPLADLEATNPALAALLAPMLDSVMELEARTGFLDVA
jgi:hypothetical protein